MPRIIMLVFVLGGCIAGVIWITVGLPGSGPQFASRLEDNWSLGELKIVRPAAADLSSMDFAEFRISTAEQSMDRPLLVLQRGNWRRPGVFPRRDGLDLGFAQLVFDGGRLNLDRSAAGAWSYEPLFAADRAGWVGAFPGEVRGLRLEVFVDAVDGEIRFALDKPRLQRGPVGISIRSGLVGSSWGEGSLEAWVPSSDRGAGPTFIARLDDANLESFPFGLLQRIAPLPWPTELPPATGRVDLDWRVAEGGAVVTAKHFQAGLQLPGLPHDLRYLTGEAACRVEGVDWRIDSAYYSQTQLSGRLQYGVARSHLTGQVRLEGVVTDRGLADSLPWLWSTVAQSVPLTGDGDLTLRFDGPTRAALRDRVVGVDFDLRELAVQGEERFESLTGRLHLEPGPARAWNTTLSLESSRVRGLRFPACELTGTISDRALNLRGSDDRPEHRLELHQEESGEIGFIAVLDGLALGDLFERGLGEAVGRLDLTGSWQAERGLLWEAKVTWYDLTLPPDATWPGPAPVGPLSGEISITRQAGRYRVEWMTVWDASRRWEMRGEIGRDGFAELEGHVIDDRAWGVVPGVGGSAALSGARFFHLRGPFFRWKVDSPGTVEGEGGG